MDEYASRLLWYAELLNSSCHVVQTDPTQEQCNQNTTASGNLNRFRSSSGSSVTSFASASSWTSTTSSQGTGSPSSTTRRRKRTRRRRRSSSGAGILGLKVIGIGDKVAGYAYDPQLTEHRDPRGQHPESPSRITRILSTLRDQGLLSRCLRVPCRNASKSELQKVHTPVYIRKLRSMERKGDKSINELVHFATQEFNSVYLNDSSFQCAKLAAGCVVESVKAVIADRCTSCFAIVRPPGHHAEAHCAMGFCIYNNVAVATQVALEHSSVNKVMIVDWDIHHGNGTQRMFWDDPNVLYFSVHRYDNGSFYPGDAGGAATSSGHKALAAGKTVNVAWNGKGFGDLEYKAVFDFVLLPIAKEFAPDLVVVSAGFDAAAGDPLGGCRVTGAGYAWMTKQLLDLQGAKVVMALEGGYNLDSISESSRACMMAMVSHASNQVGGRPLEEVHRVTTLKGYQELEETEISPELSDILPAAKKAIQFTQKVHSQFWKSMARFAPVASPDSSS